MKRYRLLENLMETPVIKSLALTEESLDLLLNTIESEIFSELLERGSIELKSGVNIEIVKLIERVHVLRGTTYRGSRKYKLKLTMSEDFYSKIESYYDKLEEEIK